MGSSIRCTLSKIYLKYKFGFRVMLMYLNIYKIHHSRNYTKKQEKNLKKINQK